MVLGCRAGAGNSSPTCRSPLTTWTALACLGLQGPCIRMGGKGTDGTCTSMQHWTGERSSHLPALGRAGDQSCLLPACRTHVPGSMGLGAGFPGSPQVGTGEGRTFYCNSLMGAMSTASPLSPTAGVAAISPVDSIAVVQGGGWLLCLAALNSLFNIGHPQNILPKGQKEVLTMSIAKLFSQKLENIFCQR